MGTKAITTGELSALPLLYDILEAHDGRQVLIDQLLTNLATTGAGDIVDVTEIAYLIHEMVQYAIQLNDQDLSKAATLLEEQGING